MFDKADSKRLSTDRTIFKMHAWNAPAAAGGHRSSRIHCIHGAMAKAAAKHYAECMHAAPLGIFASEPIPLLVHAAQNYKMLQLGPSSSREPGLALSLMM